MAAQHRIHCQIVSAEAELYSGDVEMVVAAGENGELGILPLHTPLITRLKPGQIRITANGEEQAFYVSGGILEVQPNAVTVLSDVALRAKDIDEQAVRAAQEEAKRALEGRSEAMTLAEAQQRMVETMAQLQALERLRKNLKH